MSKDHHSTPLCARHKERAGRSEVNRSTTAPHHHHCGGWTLAGLKNRVGCLLAFYSQKSGWVLTWHLKRVLAFYSQKSGWVLTCLLLSKIGLGAYLEFSSRCLLGVGCLAAPCSCAVPSIPVAAPGATAGVVSPQPRLNTRHRLKAGQNHMVNRVTWSPPTKAITRSRCIFTGWVKPQIPSGRLGKVCGMKTSKSPGFSVYVSPSRKGSA